MARTVRDLAKLLAIQSGHDARVPLSMSEPLRALPEGDDTGALRGLRVGWLADLDGYLPMEEGLLAACELALQRCAQEGSVVEPAARGFDADQRLAGLAGVAPRAGGAARGSAAAPPRRARADQARGVVGARPGAGPAFHGLHAGQRGTHRVPRALAAALRALRRAGAAGRAGVAVPGWRTLAAERGAGERWTPTTAGWR